MLTPKSILFTILFSLSIYCGSGSIITIEKFYYIPTSEYFDQRMKLNEIRLKSGYKYSHKNIINLKKQRLKTMAKSNINTKVEIDTDKMKQACNDAANAIEQLGRALNMLSQCKIEIKEARKKTLLERLKEYFKF